MGPKLGSPSAASAQASIRQGTVRLEAEAVRDLYGEKRTRRSGIGSTRDAGADAIDPEAERDTVEAAQEVRGR